MVKVGNTDIGNIYHGSIAIRKAYVGSQLVWPSSPPLPYDAEVEYVQVEPTDRIVRIPFPAYIKNMFAGKTFLDVSFSATAVCSRMGIGARNYFCGYTQLLTNVSGYGAPRGNANSISPGSSVASFGEVVCTALDDYHTLTSANNSGIVEGYIDGVKTGEKTYTSTLDLVNWDFIKSDQRTSTTYPVAFRQKSCTFSVDGQTLIDAYPVRSGDCVGYFNRIDDTFYGVSTIDYPEITAGPDKD